MRHTKVAHKILIYFGASILIGCVPAPQSMAIGPQQVLEAPHMESELELTGAKARPGYFAELEELNAARAKGTVAAYDLFLERHPNSRYAKIAMEERAALLSR